MNFIGALSIRNKLLLITLIPLAVLLYFLTDAMVEDIQTRRGIQRIYDNVTEIDQISDVIHHLQQERGFSLSFVGSDGMDERTELFSQRVETDKAIAQLKGTQKRLGRGNFVVLDRLPEIRAQVNDFQIQLDSLASLYVSLGRVLIDSVNRMYREANDVETRTLLESHTFLTNALGFLGRLRGNVHLALLDSGFTGTGFADFCSLKGSHELAMERFSKHADPELQQELAMRLRDPAVVRAQAMMDSVYIHPDLQVGFTADTWRISMTSFMRSLKEVLDLSIANVKATAERKVSEVNSALVRSAVIAVAAVLLILVLLVFTIRAIIASLGALKLAADRVAKGEVDVAVEVGSRDEIADLAASFNEMVAASKSYAEVADVIGRGEYDVSITVRGSQDLLGMALANMRANLERLSKETEVRTWLLTGASVLNERIRGDKEVRALAQEVISQLTTYLQGQVGALYVTENGQLRLAGSYAFHHRKENVTHVQFGEGLVGQAALEKKYIVFSRVPDDYIRIQSGLGSTPPSNILVYPFLYDNAVKGVIEIGSSREFSELEIELLGLVGETLGIAFNSAQSRAQLKELLEETQRQAEELEAQQEEMRQINEELMEKTGMLERSEAELKAQQEELQQTNEELEEKANLLEEQKESLELAKLEVEKKAKELEVTGKYKSEFLANMSHELRTPLNSILILTQLLSENKSNALGEKELEYARNIYSSGNDLLTLINEILDLSKIESGKMDLEIGEVYTEEIRDSLRGTFTELAKNKAIEFDFRVEDAVAGQKISTDKLRLEQILKNLLSNAFKFTSKGGRVTLDIRLVAPEPHLRNARLRRLRQVLAWSVSDTGIGIPADKQDIIFEAFQQADGSTKRKFGGTGLGLSISRELASALGGEITVRSAEGKGSTFTLYLPLEFDPNGNGGHTGARERAAAPKRLFQSPQAPVSVQDEPGTEPDAVETPADDRSIVHEKDRVVLIIEDDVKFAHVLLDFVRGRGYKGLIAHQGNVGLALARQYRPDAIILDMMLPVMDGADVLRHLKSDPSLRHIPVQIISGHDLRQEGFELGAFDFLQKPIRQAELESAFGRIEDLISRKLKRLLVVEDNPEHNQAIVELIGNGDVMATSAFNGADAYSMMESERFDCVIIDLGLPDMSGFDLMERIKANPVLNRVPIVVYTGKALSREEMARLNRLANTVVLKTADSQERLLDETTLFLHRVESKLPAEKQRILRKLHRTEEVLRGRKVLLVDDDMRNIYSVTNVLEEEGVKCLSAENGREAIEVLEANPDIEIVLMDVMMPEMDGYEATRAIRQMDQFAKLPIIALTAKAMKGDREKCLEAGMSDYITKPVNMVQLLSLMRVWLYR